jgi:homoserine O-acetyltransferase
MAHDYSVGITETQYFTFADEEPFVFESGATLGPITLAYQTYGKLDAARSNAVLICHALSGGAHAAGYRSSQDTKPGWWDSAIGPGKAFDTNRFFVICSNIIGSCYGSTGPGSVNPATGRPFGLTFPVITIGDMVRAQERLLDHLGIERLLCAVGGSLGGMQALEWAAHHPDRIRAAIPLATTARSNAMQIALSEVGRQAIYADPHWQGGDYYENHRRPDAGLAVARMIAHITYLSEESMHRKFGRRLQDQERFGYQFQTEFQVESYLKHQGAAFTQRFDANSYLYITKAIDYFDLSAASNSLAVALAGAKDVKFLIVSFTSDWLYPSHQSKEMVRALTTIGADVSYLDIESSAGHDAFLVEVDTMNRLLSSFMDRLASEEAPPPSPPLRQGGGGMTDRHQPSAISHQPSAISHQPSAISHQPSLLRPDLRIIAGFIPHGAKVLDLGCGDGALLEYLMREQGARARGIELSEAGVLACVRRGLSVRQGNLQEGLADYPDGSFDFVVLSQTLPFLDDPAMILAEMLRVGRKAIVSFPNWGYWRCRLELLITGRIPLAPDLPQPWHEKPRWQAFTVTDFAQFCARAGIRIGQQAYLAHGRRVEIRKFTNLFSMTAVFELELASA